MSACRPHFTIDWSTANANIGTNGTCTVTGDTFKETDITVRASFMVDMECGTGYPFPNCELPEVCTNVGGDKCAFPQHKVKIWEINNFIEGAGGLQSEWLAFHLQECEEKWEHLSQDGFSKDIYKHAVAFCLQERMEKGIKEGTFDWQLGGWHNWLAEDVKQELSEMYGDCCDCKLWGHSPNVRSWGHYNHSEIIDAGGRTRRN